MLKVQVKDGQGSGNGLKVNGEGEASVVVHPHPPVDESRTSLPVRQYFTLDGTATGDNDMKVNGSTNAVEFCIPASTEFDIYIKTCSVVIADASATLNKFGNIAALTNGVEFRWDSQVDGSIIIHEGLTTNFEFVRLAGGQPAFGDSAGSFRGTNVSGTSEGYIPFLDMSAIFGLPWGIRLRKGTTDKLVWKVQDDVTGIDEFNIIGYGIKI